MSGEVLLLALVVGAANWGFRTLPIRFGLGAGGGGGVLARFLAAVGPAAIATLFVASSLPFVQAGAVLAPVAGTGAVVAVWLWRRSVVLATLGGALAYAAGFALAG
ncbi:L-valine transporter subunit YgaH [Tabrizicola sp. TH137]|uniref:AzlD domain-containing protein n=1 Tax=Tabrizicola sp. TH137 TaxID=2067452 RepID=UPI000C7CDC58|nr:AzlD domain-containing protein [Tabrizicola sp. TH137]PLL12640.1 L-valine transporter subunit YgaH [Tabrizicola sp. TH137]